MFSEAEAEVKKCKENIKYTEFKKINKKFYKNELLKIKNIIYSLLKFFIDDKEVCENYKILIDYHGKAISKRNKNCYYHDIILSI